MRHGQPDPLPEREEAALLQETDDPELLLVHADMNTWLALHPCECEAGCTCDQPTEEDPCP